MMCRSVRILTSWCIGLIVWTGGVGTSFAQESPAPATLIQAAPEELQTWLTQPAPQTLLPGSYPVDQLVGVLPPHTSQLLTTEATNGTAPALEVVAPRVYEVPVSDRVHQLAANGDLDDTTRCGREMPFPGLSPSADRAGLKAVWNLLCRNQAGGFEYLGHGLRGSGPNPHRPFVINGRKAFGPQGFGFHMEVIVGKWLWGTKGVAKGADVYGRNQMERGLPYVDPSRAHCSARARLHRDSQTGLAQGLQPLYRPDLETSDQRPQTQALALQDFQLHSVCPSYRHPMATAQTESQRITLVQCL